MSFNNINLHGAKEMTQKFEAKITNLRCASCIEKISKVLFLINGVSDVAINFASGAVSISYAEDQTSPKKIQKKIISLGYMLEPEEKKKGSSSLVFQTIISAALSFPLFVTMISHLFSYSFTLHPVYQFFLATLVQAIGGYPFYKGSIQSIKAGYVGMDVLVALGTSVAFIYSSINFFLKIDTALYFETSAILITLILLGKLLEERSKNRASSSMKALLNMQPKEASVYRDNKLVSLLIEEIKIGDKALIRPFDKIPVDGVVVKGESHVDEAMLTGESVPIRKKMGDTVFSGTINQDETLEIEITKDINNTVLSQIIDLVKNAQNTKAPIQRLADKISSYFVPSIIGVSIITFVLNYFFGQTAQEAMVRAIATLIIACPCALGLATPIVIMVVTSKGAKEGILIKSPSALEKMHKLQALCLDKTGTITAGELNVRSIHVEEIEEKKAYQIAGSLASGSNHPLSKGIANILELQKLDLLEVTDFKDIAGKGIQGKIQGEIYFLGSKAFLQENKIDVSKYQDHDFIEVLLGAGSKLVAEIALEDRVKKGAKELIAKLQADNIRPYLISGDKEEIVAKVAKEVGISDFFAKVLPAQKVKHVEDLQKSMFVGFVGDGVNDAPSLAKADVGFALSTGTDVAMESSEIGLMRSDPMTIYRAITLSRLAYSKIKQNLFLAFVYNILAVPLAAIGFLSPIIASITMALSSISVITNAIMLDRKKLDV